MSVIFGSGSSTHKNPKVALKEAREMAQGQLGEHEPHFAFVYFTVGHSPKAISVALKEELGDIQHSGCSGEGVIAKNFAEEGSFGLSLMLVAGDDVKVHNNLFSQLKSRDFEVGKAIQNWSQEIENAKIMILLPDGLSCNYDSITRGIEEDLPSEKIIPIFGGLTADNFAMKETYQIHNGEVYTDSVSVAIISGEMSIAYGVNHGCSPIGAERTITKADKNIIYEIDHKPVLDVLKEYLVDDEIDNWSKAVVNLSLGFQAPKDIKDNYNDYIIRFMPQKDDQAGSITIPTEVKEGTSVWMTRRDHDKIRAGLLRIGRELKEQTHNKNPKAVFHFDCGGRGKMIMDTRSKMSLLNDVQKEIGENLPWCGFYTFGEMAPVNGKNAFHNYTAALLVIY